MAHDDQNIRKFSFSRLLESIRQAGEREPSRVTRVFEDEECAVHREVLDRRTSSWKPVRDRPEAKMSDKEIEELEELADDADDDQSGS